MRRVLLGIVALVAVASVGFALKPFDHPATFLTDGGTTGAAVSCRAPIVDAWHGNKNDSGWFGYAPLTSTPMSFPTCRGEARHRLALAALGLLGSVALGMFIFLARRPRLGDAPAPNPA